MKYHIKRKAWIKWTIWSMTFHSYLLICPAIRKLASSLHFNRLYQICEETIKLHKTAVLGNNYWRCICLSLYCPGYFETDQTDFTWTHSRVILLVARWSHLSGYFWLFAPKFWEVVGTYKLSFCSKGMQFQWC